MSEQSQAGIETVSHPEEMKGSVEARLGNVTLRAAGHTTPAGVISTGIALTAVILAVAAVVWVSNRPAG